MKTLEKERAQKRKWYWNNHEWVLERSRRYYWKNPEKKCEAERRRYWKNPEKIREKARRWNNAHPERHRERARRWNNAHPERHRENKRRWSKAHPEKNRTVHKKVSALINYCLKQAKAGTKAGRGSEDLLGYTMKTLENSLKHKIPKGYTWQDYVDGKLHLDHRVPSSAFNITSADDIAFKECWALKNLRLLPAKVNLAKQAKIKGHFQPFLPLRIQPDSQKGTIPGK